LIVALLAVKGVSKSFSGLRAVENVSFDVPEGKIVGLIGPNGAGKTTCFNMIAGVYKPNAGEILLNGERINGRRPDEICKRGVGRTFQIVKPFAGLSVLDNVVVGALNAASTIAAARQKADEVLEILGLASKRSQAASTLTLPDRKRLEVARALATQPKILLLDEVMAGLRPTEIDQMVGVLHDLNKRGLTILLIEHVMRAVMALSGNVIVLHHGELISHGTPDQVAKDPKVLECYLGEEVL
jgi:branched-chain amino acid transport system ATP-binding protein